jgi:hypothetical protein
MVAKTANMAGSGIVIATLALSPLMPQLRSNAQPRALRAGALRASALLAVLLFRAYIPIGFMPAGGAGFQLELCPVGLAGLQAHLHHHSGTHASFENCPFGSAPASGPISQHIDFESVRQTVSQPLVSFDAAPAGVRTSRAHRPRGPPSLA